MVKTIKNITLLAIFIIACSCVTNRHVNTQKTYTIQLKKEVKRSIMIDTTKQKNDTLQLIK